MGMMGEGFPENGIKECAKNVPRRTRGTSSEFVRSENGLLLR